MAEYIVTINWFFLVSSFNCPTTSAVGSLDKFRKSDDYFMVSWVGQTNYNAISQGKRKLTIRVIRTEGVSSVSGHRAARQYIVTVKLWTDALTVHCRNYRQIYLGEIAILKSAIVDKAAFAVLFLNKKHFKVKVKLSGGGLNFFCQKSCMHNSVEMDRSAREASRRIWLGTNQMNLPNLGF